MNILKNLIEENDLWEGGLAHIERQEIHHPKNGTGDLLYALFS